MDTGDQEQLLPRILCLHGGGASGTIFNIQTCRLQRALQEYFQLVFIDAPYESAPGPGVLPFFEGLGPYFRWVAWRKDAGTRTPEERVVEEQIVNKKLEEALAQEGDRGAPLVGIMGFSQGAQVAAGILLRKQTGELKNEHLRFGVLLAGTYPPICQPTHTGACDQLIRIPTVHMHGSDDAPLAQGKTLLAKNCDPNTASLMRFKGGHHLPTLHDDTKRLADMILQASEKSRVHGNGQGEIRWLLQLLFDCLETYERRSLEAPEDLQ